MTTTPILALDELASGQAIPEVLVNENTRWLEFFAAGGAIVDRDDTAPPGLPVDGEAYLVDATATGAWAGHDGEIALRISTAWAFKTPTEGMRLYVADEDITIVYDGSAWGNVAGATYTDEMARDAIGTALTDSGLAVVTPNDGADTIDINVPAASGSDFRTGTDATKALTSDAVWDAAASVALTDGATVTPDFAAGINFTWTIGGNRTLANPSNLKPGQTGCIEITQDGTGSRTISSYGSDYRFAGGTDIVLSTAAGTLDLLFYYVTAGSKVLLSAQKAIAA